MPYPNINPDTWTAWSENVQVWYSSPENRKEITYELRKTEPDAVYINSLFSLHFSISPLWQHLKNPLASQVVIVPRGMLHAGAMQYGKIKKKFFLSLFNLLGIHKKITWQATDEQEKKDISRHFGKNVKIVEIGNVPTVFTAASSLHAKSPGQLTMLFVSRIQPKKNLEFLIDRMARLKGKVQLDIIGPVEDEPYWEKIQSMIAVLPGTHRVNHLGAIPHHEIMERQQNYHLFCLPTHGENFGHAIFDAMIGGLPILISDQTPWQSSAENQIGWTLPLNDIDQWQEALSQAMNWNQIEFNAASMNASEFAQRFLAKSNLKPLYLDLFFPLSHE